MKRFWISVCILGLAWMGMGAARAADKITFERKQLSETFYCEGAHFGDFNKDGKQDVVIGPYWYEGPAFTKRHERRPVKPFNPLKYSDEFLTFVHDFNGDGWDDIGRRTWPLM